jgi:hypothetical protein
MTMKPFLSFLRKPQFAIFLVFYLLFAGLTLFALLHQSPSDWRENWNVAATVGAFSGPFTGAIARQLQSCCLEFSFKLLPWCAGILALGVGMQFVPMPWKRVGTAIRLLVWVLAVAGWFAGGVVSLGHALS